LLRELVEAEPDEPLFHWRLGYALSEMQKHREAIKEFRQALKLDPKNVAALGCLGREYMEVGNGPKQKKQSGTGWR
jgi:Flp pilus assembly protein TadD